MKLKSEINKHLYKSMTFISHVTIIHTKKKIFDIDTQQELFSLKIFSFTFNNLVKLALIVLPL